MQLSFQQAQNHILKGDFTYLDPLCEGDPSCFGEWLAAGCFNAEQLTLDEALSCACFNGRHILASKFLDAGADPVRGDATGLSAIHWATNRGHLSTVRLLIDRGVSTETLNSFGGTVLSCAIWSYIHENKPDHLRIINVLLTAGAIASSVSLPTGDNLIDTILRSHLESHG